MAKPIYLDYNATTPHDPEVIEAMRPFLEEEFGNPSSSHSYGNAPQMAVMEARRQVATLLNCSSEEITFTSGGTESNNHAIKGVADAYGDKGNHIITSRIEHPAILEVCGYLEKKGMKVTYLPVDDQGLVSVSAVERAVTARTVLIYRPDHDHARQQRSGHPSADRRNRQDCQNAWYPAAYRCGPVCR
jgi:cysteine desulfurase